MRRAWCVGLAAATVVLGIGWRTAPLGMPLAVYKYGGSALWAAMIYLLVAAGRPMWRPVRVLGIAMLVAGLVEAFKLVRQPGLDAFRLTLAGKLLLGRIFSWSDLAVYAAAIAAVACADLYLGAR